MTLRTSLAGLAMLIWLAGCSAGPPRAPIGWNKHPANGASAVPVLMPNPPTETGAAGTSIRSTIGS